MKDNKLIAEFMGVVFHDDENQYYSSDGVYIGNTLQYHSSWDWLMPVVDKIEQVHEGVPTQLINLSLFSTKTETYKAVVEFIKQYNS